MGVPYKRPAPDKSGVPVYQPTGNAAYQQALMQQLGGQSYVPVSCEYGAGSTTSEAAPPESSSPASSTTSTVSASPSVPLYTKRPPAPVSSLKTTATIPPQPPTSSSTAFPTSFLTPGALLGASHLGFPTNFAVPASLQIAAAAAATGNMVGGLAGLGVAPSSVPVVPQQLVYPHSTPFVFPQLTTLSNNPQHAWAGGAGEQPYKKLKTS